MACMILLACGPREGKKTIRIAAAASTKFALDSLVRDFETSFPLECRVSYASSGLLASQILEGAPFDIFLSANESYCLRINEEDRAGSPVRYAEGRLVIWSNTRQISDSTLNQDLLAMRKIALPNPKVAPYGVAAQETLEGLGLIQTLQERLVFGESVGQTSHFISSGASDAGFTALSIILAEDWRSQGSYVLVPKKYHRPLYQYYTILDPSREGTSDLAKYLASPQAHAILEHFGYLVPDRAQ